MPKYLVLLALAGSVETRFFDDKDQATEYFTDIWTGYNDFDQVQLYHFYCGRYTLLRDVLKGDNL